MFQYFLYGVQAQMFGLKSYMTHWLWNHLNLIFGLNFKVNVGLY